MTVSIKYHYQQKKIKHTLTNMHGNHLIVMNRKTNPVPNNNNNNFNIKSIKEILKNILWIQIIHASVVLLQKKKVSSNLFKQNFSCTAKNRKIYSLQCPAKQKYINNTCWHAITWAVRSKWWKRGLSGRWEYGGIKADNLRKPKFLIWQFAENYKQICIVLS